MALYPPVKYIYIFFFFFCSVSPPRCAPQMSSNLREIVTQLYCTSSMLETPRSKHQETSDEMELRVLQRLLPSKVHVRSHLFSLIPQTRTQYNIHYNAFGYCASADLLQVLRTSHCVCLGLCIFILTYQVSSFYFMAKRMWIGSCVRLVSGGFIGGGFGKRIVWQIGKYAYSLSCQDLYKEIDNTVICFCLGWRW